MDIREKISEIKKLAPLPIIVSQVLEVTADPDASARDLATLIKKDQPLTAKILKITNSAYYGFNRRIGNVDHAIVILGFNEVRSITLALCLMKYYPIEESHYFRREMFWTHAIGTAHIARALSLAKRELNSEDAYVIGLLHDFGKVILDQFFPDVFRSGLRIAAKENRSLREVIYERLGIDHAEIGMLVAESWDLPVPLTNAIRYHHSPAAVKESDHFVHLAHLANYFCHRQRIGRSGNPKPDALCPGSIRSLGLENKTLDEIWESLNIDTKSISLFL